MGGSIVKREGKKRYREQGGRRGEGECMTKRREVGSGRAGAGGKGG